MTPRKPHRRASGGTVSEKENRETPPAAAGKPSAERAVPKVKAAEDDPRVWGDAPEDRDSWLLEQRPPHWG